MPRAATSAVLLTLAAAVALGGCANTLQDQPIADAALGRAVGVHRFPIYWAGRTFEGMPLSGTDRDPGGAFDMSYGDCVVGGQGTCVAPLLIVTSPDNSFVPGGGRRGPRTLIRGRSAVTTQGGRTIELATGTVVVSIFAQTPLLARLAAAAMMPVNLPGEPYLPLDPPAGDSGFARAPLGGNEAAPAPGAGNL